MNYERTKSRISTLAALVGVGVAVPQAIGASLPGEFPRAPRREGAIAPRRRRPFCPWLVVIALVVPLVACSTECERAAAKVCKAAQAADFATCIKRATAKACKAAEAAAFDFGTFDTCVANEVIRCRGGR